MRHEVTAIDRENRTVTVRNLETGAVFAESYDKLVLSPGAVPVRPKLPGIESARIETLRTVEDTLRIRRFVEDQKPKTAVLAGGGFIGLEMAENLVEMGVSVTIVQRPKQLLAPLDADMASFVHAEMRRHGVALRLGETVTGFRQDGDSVLTLLEESEPLRSDMVLLAIGGQNAVSVYGILMTMDGFVHPLLYGMCDSLQPAVGFNWGARNIQRVKAIEKRCYTAAIILALATTGVLALFPRQIAGLFITGDSDPAYLEMAVHALVLFSLTYITRWFSFATQSFLSAIEKPVAASAISVCTALVFPVILIGVFWPLGLTGLWLNFAGTAVLAGILALILLLRQKELWKKDGTESA